MALCSHLSLSTPTHLNVVDICYQGYILMVVQFFDNYIQGSGKGTEPQPVTLTYISLNLTQHVTH